MLYVSRKATQKATSGYYSGKTSSQFNMQASCFQDTEKSKGLFFFSYLHADLPERGCKEEDAACWGAVLNLREEKSSTNQTGAAGQHICGYALPGAVQNLCTINLQPQTPL